MAAQTWSADGNFDDSGKAGLANNEQVNIDTGAILTQNSDTRWAQQAAIPSSVVITAASGGTWRVDATETWWIAYDGATGNLMTLGTYSSNRTDTGVNTNLITRSGTVIGELLTCHNGDGASPIAAGAALSTATRLKMRWKDSGVTLADNDVLTFTNGSTVTVNTASPTTAMPAAGQAGWLNVVLISAATTTVTVPRLGTFETDGQFFYLGDTNAANDQTFQYYVADFCPMIEVETASGSGIYEVWLAAGSRWGTATQTVSLDARGKFFNCSSTGLITLATLTGGDSGFKPVTGCKVRVPNIHFSAATSASPTANVIPADTQADRPETAGASNAGGIYNLSYCNFGPFYLNLSQFFSADILHCGFNAPVVINEAASEVNLSYVGIGYHAAQVDTVITMTSCFAGGAWDNCKFARYELTSSGQYGSSWSNSSGFTFDACTFFCFGTTVTSLVRGNATTGVNTWINMLDCTFNDCVMIGGRNLLATCTNMVFNDLVYSDVSTGNTGTTIPQSCLEFTIKCNNVTLDGLTFLVSGSQPRTALALINASDHVKVRNIGTKASPLNLAAAGSGTTYLISSVGNSSDLQFKRIYCDNAVTGPILWSTNADTGVVIENVWSDAAETESILALNHIAKGTRWTNTTTGQVSVYGTHFNDLFTSTTAGRLVLHCNEKTGVEPSASAYTVNAGTPKFNSQGGVQMATVGDQLTWQFGYDILGHTSFATTEATLTGTVPDNIDLAYDLKQSGGAFSGTFKNLHYKRPGGGGGSGTTNVTMTSTTGVAVNDYIYGTGIGSLSRVQSITNGTTIVATVNNSGAVSGTLRFSQLPNETVTDASLGFDLKIRATTSIAAATSALTYVRIDTVSTTAAQAYQYTLDPVPITVTVLDINTLDPIEDARVYMTAAAGGDLTLGDLILTGTTDVDGQLTTDSFAFTNDQPISGRVRQATGGSFYKTAPLSGTITSDGLTATVFLIPDE